MTICPCGRGLVRSMGWCEMCAQEGIHRLPAIPQEADPHGIGQHDPGAKLDAGKPQVWLCVSGFARALGEVAKVSTIGAKKYSPGGWRTVPDGRQRYMDAAMRHLLALGRGEELDADTGCMHLAQAAWNVLASLELELREREEKGG